MIIFLDHCIDIRSRAFSFVLLEWFGSVIVSVGCLSILRDMSAIVSCACHCSIIISISLYIFYFTQLIKCA